MPTTQDSNESQTPEEKMQADFEAVKRALLGNYPAGYSTYDVYIESKRVCASQSAETIARLTEKANSAEKWKGIALAQDGDGRTVQQIETPLLEKIARLEEENRGITEHYNELLEAARSESKHFQERDAKKLEAAELSNKQLRDAGNHVIDSLGVQYHIKGDNACDFYQITNEVIAVLGEALDAQQPSTEALDAYVAEKTAELQRKFNLADEMVNKLSADAKQFLQVCGEREAALKAKIDALDQASKNLDWAKSMEAVVEYARKDGAHGYIPMAAFDSNRVAEHYAASQGESRIWMYRVSPLPPTPANQEE